MVFSFFHSGASPVAADQIKILSHPQPLHGRLSEKCMRTSFDAKCWKVFPPLSTASRSRDV
jgi:hypothetical protein